MADQPLGPIIDGLDLDEGDLIPDAVVLAKVVTADGQVTLAVCSNDNMSWLDQLGIVTAASDIIRSGRYGRPDDD